MALAALVALLAVVVCSRGVHQGPEGHVAAFFRGGALLAATAPPGFCVANPLFTRVEFVDVTVQTDVVDGVPCGTASGSMIEFDRVEVVNRLDARLVIPTLRNYTTKYDRTWIFDKIHHEINQLCSKSTLEEMYITKFETLDEWLRDALNADIRVHAPGIHVLFVRDEPRILEAILRNYDLMESERTRLQIVERTQKIVE